MLLLNVYCCAYDGSGLHSGDFRICDGETASAVAHHRVKLMERGDDGVDISDALVLSLGELGDVIGFSRDKFVKRRIEETDRDGISFEGFIELFKIALLHRKDFCQRGFSLFDCVRADHFAECGDSVRLEEHVFRTA
ncbi:hypothetical protein SDC9_161765 [bioreactor metagenome]|uniref:Uncharacterized protein n=1 Tax=bioreactor metagenome TaxID=1076179 RepID=A0A645FJ57_9ZZZZ